MKEIVFLKRNEKFITRQGFLGRAAALRWLWENEIPRQGVSLVVLEA